MTTTDTVDTVVSGLLVALGAGAGAPLRYAVAQRLDARWPTGTLAVNLLGSLVLGVVSALALSGHLSQEWVALLGTGFCGGFTTYSSFVVQTRGLGPRTGALYAAVSLLGGLGLCALGFLLAA